MKKLTTLFILIFIVSTGLFANPKIPKIENYLDSLDSDFTGTNYLCYMNNSCTNFYKIFAVTDTKYTLYFSNTSLVTNINITLCMNFPSERELDNYIYELDTSDLENEFRNIRKTFIKYNINPVYSTGKNDTITKITYTVYQN